MSLFSMIVFDLLTTYFLLYIMLAVSRRYKQIALDPDVFEELTELRVQHNATISDMVGALLIKYRKELARNNGATH